MGNYSHLKGWRVLFGQVPRSRIGRAFHSDPPEWGPLVEYCRIAAPVLWGKCDWHAKGSSRMNGTHARGLAKRLQKAIDSGHTARYADKFQANNEILPYERCWACDGTGRRKAPPEVGAGNEPCAACHRTGNILAAEAKRFSVDGVQAFVRFLHQCGGFVIRDGHENPSPKKYYKKLKKQSKPVCSLGTANQRRA